MTAFNFGVGTVIMKRTDIALPKPVLLGIMSDISVDVDRTLKSLMGKNSMPVDVAPADLKVSGKGKFARMQSNSVNDLLLGNAISATGSKDVMAVAEVGTVPSPSGPYTIVVTHGGTYVEDLGVFDSQGVQLKPVTGSVTISYTYAVDATTGTYTFAAGDAALTVNIYYTYKATGLTQIVASNTAMGVGPSFEMHLQENYVNNANVNSTFYLRLNACRSSKMAMAFKNNEYTSMEIDFQAFADVFGNWGLWTFTE